MKRLAIRACRNPKIDADFDEEPGCYREHVKPVPFLLGVETRHVARIYTFAPTATEQFKIGVKLPYGDDEELTLDVVDIKVAPRHLQDAIDFIKKNEQSFVEAVYASQSGERRKGMECASEPFIGIKVS